MCSFLVTAVLMGAIRAAQTQCSGSPLTINSGSGVFTSPNYPNEGGSEEECIWEFLHPLDDDSYQLELTLTTLFSVNTTADEYCAKANLLLNNASFSCLDSGLSWTPYCRVFTNSSDCEAKSSCEKEDVTDFTVRVKYESDGNPGGNATLRGFVIAYKYLRCLQVTSTSGPTTTDGRRTPLLSTSGPRTEEDTTIVGTDTTDQPTVKVQYSSHQNVANTGPSTFLPISTDDGTSLSQSTTNFETTQNTPEITGIPSTVTTPASGPPYVIISVAVVTGVIAVSLLLIAVFFLWKRYRESPDRFHHRMKYYKGGGDTPEGMYENQTIPKRPAGGRRLMEFHQGGGDTPDGFNDNQEARPVRPPRSTDEHSYENQPEVSVTDGGVRNPVFSDSIHF